MQPPTFDRSYADGVLSKKLDNFMKEFDGDVTLNETNIHDKTLLRASIAAKWCRYEYEERRFKDKIQAAIDALKNKVANELFEEKKKAVVAKIANETLIKMEAEKRVKSDVKYYELKKALEEQEDVLRFIAEAKQIISQFGFDIKNAIDVLKLES